MVGPRNSPSGGANSLNCERRFKSQSKLQGFTMPNLLLSVCVFICVLVSPCNSIHFRGERETYSKFPKWDACINASVTFEFKSTQRNGILMYTDDNGRYDYLQVALTDGAVRLWINFVREKEQNVEIELGRNLNDGNWHRVEVKRNRMETTLLVDNNQSSKVAFGSDFSFGEELETNNYMYFGGVPSNYKQNIALQSLPAEVLNSPLVGQIRNILYFNCSCMPVRASMLEGKGVNEYPREACDIRNPCPKDCPCISGDDGPGCECDYRRECIKDLLAHYQLPMDSVDRDLIMNPSGLDSRVYGGPELVRGVHEMAMKIDGTSQWIRVSGPSHKKECFGDLDHCPKGYYVGMWINFQSPSNGKAIYMSNGGHISDGHGIAMSYSGTDGIEFIFKKKDGTLWTVSEKDVLPAKWYHVAASWDQVKGLHLYINGNQMSVDKSPRRSGASRDGGAYKDFVLGRSNDRAGLRDVGTVMVDDFSFMSAFKSEEDMREEGPAFHYHLPMDSVSRDTLDMIGGDARVYGGLQTVPGKIKQAVSFTGRGEYVDLGETSKKCLGDLDMCKHGFYISFFVRFSRLDNDRGYIFSSPHGMDIYQVGSQMIASAQKDRRSWEARYNGLSAGTWYFVEVSWSEGQGISMYVDGREVDRQARESYAREPRSTREMKAFIGRSNEGGRREQLSNTMLDDMDIYYGTRDMLSNIGYIQTDRPSNLHFDFEDIRGNRMIHDRMTIVLLGSPDQTDGKVGQALRLNGRNQVADFGDQSEDCFGNLDRCHHGALYSLWLRPDRLRSNMYFLSSGDNGITLKYRGQKLHVMAETSAKKWEATTSNIEENNWYFIEVSFHPVRGLGVYINNELVAEDTTSAPRSKQASRSAELDRFYLGRGNVDMADAKFGEATYDEMEMWYADRDYLSAHGHIQRTRPRSFLIPFEELINEDRLMHPDLSIRLVGRPVLIPGKVNNALELSGRGQYADLGRRGDECMSNLARCTQGFTVAAWMRFHRFENNMVFLSTGENGILMMYKDGYIQVSADGRGIITTPRFETGRWYFVEITWHPETGLQLYVDNELKGQSAKDTVGRAPNRGSFYIGRPNQGDVPTGRYATGNMDVDEMEIWYGRRDDLLAFGYINREDYNYTNTNAQDNLGYEAFSLDSATGRTIAHTKYIVLLVNGANLVPGRFGNAVTLNGRGQYVDLGTHFERCFGNLDYCTHGLTLSMWLNPLELRDGTTFFSSPTYNLYYEDGQLNSEFMGKDTTWSTSTSRLRRDEWQRITMAWHPKKGLTMYINDELVDQDRRGEVGGYRDQPVSEHIYIGRDLGSDRNTANMMADELQVWYDDLDQLRATGQYRVQVVPTSIFFDDFRNNVLRIRDREIRGHGDIQLVQGKGENSRAIRLLGTSGYLDLGSNFTCGGDLDTCRQGATMRLGLKPMDLRDGMVFFDSYPVRLYYKDGRLYGQLQTATQVWTVDTQEFRPREWQRVELSWHPRDGLTMYIDGRRVDYQTYPVEQTSRVPADWRTYFGRALQGGQTYANTAVDSIEFWSAYRDSVPEDEYLQIEPYVPPPPVTRRPVTSRPVTRRPYTRRPYTRRPYTRRPDIGNTIDVSFEVVEEFGRVTPQQPTTRQVKIIQLNGNSYVYFDLRKLPPEYLQAADKEDFQFYFLTDQPDGLIWYHEDTSRKMYLAMKDGQLMFVNDDNTGSPDEIFIGRRDNVRFDDNRWHQFKVTRRGRRIALTVDNRHQEDYIFSRNVQFLFPVEVYLGGTLNTYQSTGGRVSRNFQGGLALVLYQTELTQGNRNYRNEVNLIAELGDDGGRPGVDIQTIDWPEPGATWTYRPITTTTTPRPTTPQPRLTSITIKDEGIYFILQERFQVQSGSSLSFKFRTIKRDALLMFATSNILGKNYIALEIYDGKLYMVHNFGRDSKRTLLSDIEVSDGQTHEVELRFYDTQIATKLDAQSKRIRVDADEELPRNLGQLYVGGYNSYEFLPWHTWARRGYQGCLEDLKINGRIIDLQRYIQQQQLYGRVDQSCSAMPQTCSVRPCVHGYCVNQWGGYYCNCRGTDYIGDQCSLPAWTGVFNGSVHYKLTFIPQQKYHADNLSFRFKTMVSDGFLFQTKARSDGGFMRGELEGGRIKITTNLGGQDQVFYVGDNLNDMQWHTVYMQRRGNQMEVWVDDQDHQKKILPGAGYFLYVDNIFIGGFDRSELNVPDSSKQYIGYIRNFLIGETDVLKEIHGSGAGPLYREPNIPPLVFRDITIPNYNAYIQLPSLNSGSSLNINFLFRTNDANGVIMFTEGQNQELFAIEMFGGRLHAKIHAPGKPPMRMVTPEYPKFNDGQWHSVSIIRQEIEGQKQLSMLVDSLRSSYTYSPIDQINLQGPLYVGGIPTEFYQKQHIKDFLSSKSGYRGCMASVDFGQGLPDIFKYGQEQGVNILNSCQDIVSQCTKTTCRNGGICHDHLNNGTTWCDCSMTGYAGPACEDEPLGYYFRSEGDRNKYGMLVYEYPPLERNDNEKDEIVMGVMTDEKNAVLAKLISGVFDDFIEIKLENGYVVVTYDTDGQGASTTITNGDVLVSDGQYHIIRFVRTKDRGTLYVDEAKSFNQHATSHGSFDRLSKIFIGGVYQGGKVVDGTGFRGIVGGLYVNGELIFPYAERNTRTTFISDVVVAPHPYKLGPLQPLPTTPKWQIITTPKPVVTTTRAPIIGIPQIPPDVGGAGMAWEGAAGATGTGGGPGGVNVVIFPDGSGGSAGGVPLPPPLTGAEGAVSAAQVAVVPSLPVTGPRAGAVMGTILGLAALASSLMWAFYRCKPGWCGGAGGPAASPMTISPPRAGTNLAGAGGAGAGGAGAGGAGAGAGGAGGGLDVVDAGVAGGATTNGTGGGGGSSSYYFSQQAIGGGHQRTESYDSATLRATGTFSNKGTALGTPRAGRHQFSSVTSGAYSESNVMSPASLQSYHFEGGATNADYDVASGVHSNYQSNTLTSGAGGGGGGGGFSSATMSSNYNYSVKTIRTVGGQQAMMGYAAGSQNNVIVTPGAMGEEIRVDCCLMTNDGHSVVTGSSLGPPQVWNMTSGELLRIMQGETVGSTNLHLVCNDRLLVGAINSDLEINQYSVPKGVHNYIFQIWDFASGRPLDMAEHETCSALTVMSDNDKVVFGRSDKFGGGTNIIVWDLLGNQPIKEMRYDAPVGNNDYLSFMKLSQNDRYVIAGFTNTFDNFAEFVIFDMTLTAYNISDPNILRLDANPECTAVLPRDEAVTGLRNGDLVVWSLRTGQPSRQLLANNGKHAHSREVKGLARSEDNKYLVSASADGTLKLWDLETERHVTTMSGHNDEVWCAAISSDNEIVVSGSRDGTIRLWQLKSGKEICAFNAGVDVFYITMSHDKGTIVALGDKFGARKLIMLQVVRTKVKRQVLA